MHGRFLQIIYFFCIQISSILESQFNINRHFAFSREDARDSGNNAEIWQFYLIKSIFILKVFFDTSNPTREKDCFEFILPSVNQPVIISASRDCVGPKNYFLLFTFTLLIRKGGNHRADIK